MKRIIRPLVLALLLTTAGACSSTQPPNAASVQGNSVIATIKDLSSFYGKKNLPGFMSLVAGEFKDRQSLAGAVQTVFGGYDSVHFRVQYPRMIISIDDKGVPRATFNWESGWEKAGGSVLKNSGRATFVFEPKGGKLAAIEGKNPFVPQAIEPQKP